MRLHTSAALAPHNHRPVLPRFDGLAMAYFSCAICHRVSALKQLQLKCPHCGSLIGEHSPEPPAVPKGVVRPGGRHGFRDGAVAGQDR
jgi:hypothetical protein